METNIVDSIVENLFRIMPLIRRKLLKVDLAALDKDISHLHFVIMTILDEAGMLPVSVIGKRLGISKPQMTHLVDKLISLRLVKRLPDARDRRIINVRLTDNGKITLEECRKLISDNIRGKLSCLKDEELAELSASLEKIRDIGAKLE